MVCDHRFAVVVQSTNSGELFLRSSIYILLMSFNSGLEQPPCFKYVGFVTICTRDLIPGISYTWSTCLPISHFSFDCTNNLQSMEYEFIAVCMCCFFNILNGILSFSSMMIGYFFLLRRVFTTPMVWQTGSYDRIWSLSSGLYESYSYI